MNKELISNTKKKFKDYFGQDPLMIFSPGRINLIGEHTDYNDGFVFPAAINKGIVAALSKSKTTTCTIFALDMNESHEFELTDLKAIVGGNWRNYVLGVCAELQKKGIEFGAFNLAFSGDIPKGAGLSSSAALENSVVYGLNELFGLNLTKTEMIFISQKAEHNFAGVQCGIMDQYASMFGKENHALLLDCRSLESESYQLNLDIYSILLINSNVSHNLVEAEYNDRRAVCEHVAKLLGVQALRDATEESLASIKDQLSDSDYQKALYILQENERVVKAGNCLKNDDLEGFGAILYQGHQGARDQFKISCKELDFLVEKTLNDSKILGSRMMGGGFGGCTINLVENDYLADFSKMIQKDYIDKLQKPCSLYSIELSRGVHRIN